MESGRYLGLLRYALILLCCSCLSVNLAPFVHISGHLRFLYVICTYFLVVPRYCS